MAGFIKVPFQSLPVLQTVGRAGGSFERTDPQDRNEWNSDDEDVDEFGRRKKRKTTGRKAPQEGSGFDETSTKATGSEEAFAKANSGAAYGWPGKGGMNMAPGMAPWTGDSPGKGGMQMQGLQQMAAVLQQMAGNMKGMGPKGTLWRPPQAADAMGKGGKSNAWPGIEAEETNTKSKVPVRPWNGVPIVPCKFYMEGNCSRGETCTFLHSGPGGLAECKYWTLGICNKGASCPFRHIKGRNAGPASFVDFETGMLKSTEENTPSSSSIKTQASTPAAKKAPEGGDSGAGGTGVNMDEALEELLNMV